MLWTTAEHDKYNRNSAGMKHPGTCWCCGRRLPTECENSSALPLRTASELVVLSRCDGTLDKRLNTLDERLTEAGQALSVIRLQHQHHLNHSFLDNKNDDYYNMKMTKHHL